MRAIKFTSMWINLTINYKLVQQTSKIMSQKKQ